MDVMMRLLLTRTVYERLLIVGTLIVGVAFSGLAPLPLLDLGIIAGLGAAWAIGLRYAWRAQRFERFLGLEVRVPAPPHAARSSSDGPSAAWARR